MTAIADTASESDRQKAFLAARRHAVRVRVMRIALPVIAVLITAGLAVSAFRPENIEIGPVAFDALELQDGALVMENPRLSGVDRNARAYTLTAVSAAQHLDRPSVVELTAIDAQLAVDSETTARVLADRGEFDQGEENLHLFNGVNVTASNGYQVRMHDAFVDLKDGEMVSHNPVAIDMLNGTLTANGVRIVDRGALIRFNGGVSLTLYLRPQGDTAAAADNN